MITIKVRGHFGGEKEAVIEMWHTKRLLRRLTKVYFLTGVVGMRVFTY